MSDIAPLPSKLRNDLGFSLIEAIIVLVIASMVISALLPIVFQSTRQNTRYGSIALNQVERILDERIFRTLLMSAVPARQALVGRPATTTIHGNQQELQFLAAVDGNVGCAVTGETAVRLYIQNRAQDRGGSLHCQGAAGERELIRWDRGGGSFSYRLDTDAWSPLWPPAGQDEQAWMFASDTPLVRAPYVRFEITVDSKSALAWVEQSGAIEPIDFDPNRMFNQQNFEERAP